MDRVAYIEVLKSLGHYRCAVVRKANGSGFYAQCECGYQSTTRRTQRDAIETIEHHRSKVLKITRSGGVSLPGMGLTAG